MLLKLLMDIKIINMLNMYRGVEVVEVLDDEDEADKDLTNPQWSALIVINSGILDGNV